MYVSKHCLKIIKVNKILTFYVSKYILRNVMIESVKKLNVLVEWLISPRQVFAQIYRLATIALHS